MSSPTTHDATHDAIRDAVKRHWGFDELRPIQAEAINAGIQRRDSLVVMPTGGGKSLCYQVPPLVLGKVGVVVSPLIALMKDQVDALRLVGYPAGAIHSNLAPGEAARIERELLDGELRLLLLSPERLLTDRVISMLQRAQVESFAIDEAHCISQWGHDFRPEYRRMAELRHHFPGASLHAYTATATPRVREDIVSQLALRDPTVLVGRFDRPNLTYRVVPRVGLVGQVAEVLERHPGDAGIVYAISRKDTESLAAGLQAAGIDAKAYHAGMDAGARSKIQDDFRFERLNVVVATVAFGMGIDRSDVRSVIHAAMPKTVEAYQQETGRAGRDGLPAECVMLYSPGDLMRWKRLITNPSSDEEADPQVTEAQMRLLNEMQRMCGSVRCRHKALSEYFGQEYAPQTPDAGCGACDVCLGEMNEVADATTIAQKILSCVARVNQSFGAKHVGAVLRGSATARVVEKGHQSLSTFGLLAGVSEPDVQAYIDQLIDQGVLARTDGEYPVLVLTPESRAVLRSEKTVVLREAKTSGASPAERRRRPETGPALTNEERTVFEGLRALRRSIADELNVPAYVVFGDATLQELARIRPGSTSALLNIRGVGQRKLEQFGERILAYLDRQCTAAGLSRDVGGAARPAPSPRPVAEPSRPASSLMAGELFDQGLSIAQVAAKLGRAESTVRGYLGDYIASAKPLSVSVWVDDATYARVERALAELGPVPFRVVFEHLGGEVGYDLIRIVRDHLAAMGKLTQPTS